jgi:carboxylesterase type B
MFVYTNYRVNAFGFLPGKEIADDPTSDTNVALRDQEYALQWVQKHIEKFGGNPRNVTIWGQSAGGGSVLAQTISGHSHVPPLFSKALALSPFWPKTYRYDSADAQWIYDKLANLTGCAGPGSLKCLKQVDVQAIRNASLQIAESHRWTTSSWTWVPVIGDDFLPVPLSEAAVQGKLKADFAFSFYNTFDGQNFLNPDLVALPPNSTEEPFLKWVHGFLPSLSTEQMNTALELYPIKGGAESIASYNETWVRAELIYRDLVFTCPGYWMAGAARKGGYLAEYAILPAKHASETYWVSRRPA